MAEYKTFIPAAWTEFTAKCKALFPFLKKTFVGTRAEWNALSTAEKIKYDVCDLTDDVAGGEMIVRDDAIPGDYNPITSSAVAYLLEVEQDSSDSYTIEPQGYAEWQTTISTTKAGYRVASLTAFPLSNDAIITTVHELHGTFRVTAFNCATVQQTQALRIIVTWIRV